MSDAAAILDTGLLGEFKQALSTKLPGNWQITTLGETFKWGSGGTPKRTNPAYYGGNIPWLIIGDLDDGVVSESETNITEEGLANSSAKLVEPGSVLLAMYGSIGKLGITGRALTTNQAIAFTKPDVDDAKYLFYYLMFVRNKLARLGKGATQKNISQTVIKAFPYVRAPIDDQPRIVAEIEKQFSRLDEAVTSVKRVKANLKRYKAAVLKAAVEGKLTAEWRKQNPDVEPASKLLERILGERRAKWEESELAKMKAKGKAPKNDEWKEKYSAPTGPVATTLTDLPAGWVWSTFDRLAGRVTVGHVGSMKNEYVEVGVPFLRSQNVRENRYDATGLKFISDEFHARLSKSSLMPGDLVIVRSGSVGVTCVIPEQLRVANCSDLVIVKALLGALPEFGAYYMNSIVNTRVAAGKVGVALVHFNTKSVADMPVPVPPMKEQIEIVGRVEKELSVIEVLVDQLDSLYLRFNNLRTSVLDAAFKGLLFDDDSLPSSNPSAMRGK